MKTKILTLCLALATTLFVWADENGTCGDNLTWTLTTSNSTLKISGKGKMFNYAASTPAPWYVSRSGIKVIIIANGVTTIGDSAFYDCADLNSVTTPNSVTSIGTGAFSGCDKLISFTCEGNPEITSAADFLLNKRALKNITAPASILNVAETQRALCPDSLLYVRVTGGELTNEAFEIINMSQNTLQTLHLAVATNTHLADDAFKDYHSLKTLVLPLSLESIGTGAFSGCDQLISFTCEGNPEITSAADFLLNKRALKNITAPASILNVAETQRALCPDSLLYVRVTGGELTDNAFGVINMSKNTLQTLHLAVATNTHLADNVFKNYHSLTTLILPVSLEYIGASAFYGCSKLTSLTIPLNVTSIGTGAFSGCDQLISFTCEGNPEITSAADFLLNKSVLKTITAPASIFSVDETQWESCSKILIYVKVTGGELTDNAFGVINMSQNSLQTLHLAAATNTELADNVFKDYSSLKTLVLPVLLDHIGASAFYGCSNLTSVIIPSNVKNINNSVFSHTGLTSVIIPEGVLTIGDGAFWGCKNLSSATIPSSLTHIGTGAFTNTGLTSISIPSSVIYIGGGAFYNCDNLLSVVIPEGVIEIGSAAFYDCTNLKDLTLPNSLQQIGENCFALCNKLDHITTNAIMPPMIESNTFAGVNLAILLNVPAGCLEAYQEAMYWSEFSNISEAPTTIKQVNVIEGVYVQDGHIVIEKNRELPVAIYDVVGRLVVRGSSFINNVAVPHSGVYIVIVGNQTMKVLVP